MKKLNYKQTFIVGFGFFTISLVWPLYNNYVPLFLEQFFSSNIVINGIMTLDNILALFLIPFISNLSDNTNSKYGRRMPFIMIGLPIAAVLFIFLPFTTNNLAMLIVMLFCLNSVMAIFRGPTVALMPDLTPKEFRSKANGIINFMGGIASAIVLIGGAYVYRYNSNLPFVGTGVIMIIALVVLMKNIKEPKYGEKSADEKIKLWDSVKEVIYSKSNKNRHALIAIFLWYFAYQGMEASFSRYATHYLGYADGSYPSLILGAFALTFLLCAIPAGIIGEKIGKKKAIVIGLGVDIIVFGFLAFIGPDSIIEVNTALIMGCMAVAGAFWSLVNINAYPIVLEGIHESKVGTYTGLYYTATSIAAIMGPFAFGAFIDLFGFGSLFSMIMTIVVMAFIMVLTINEKKEMNIV